MKKNPVLHSLPERTLLRGAKDKLKPRFRVVPSYRLTDPYETFMIRAINAPAERLVRRLSKGPLLRYFYDPTRKLKDIRMMAAIALPSRGLFYCSITWIPVTQPLSRFNRDRACDLN